VGRVATDGINGAKEQKGRNEDKKRGAGTVYK